MNKHEIVKRFREISRMPMTEFSHGFNDYGKISIGVAARKSTKIFSDRAKQMPAVSLINVILATNRNYAKVVEPNIVRIKSEGKIKSFFDLKSFMLKSSMDEFYKFWGHRDKNKYDKLKNVLTAIDKLKIKYKAADDFEVMNRWANSTNLKSRKTDLIGGIKGIGIATFQHLRMDFGANTVKPDLRVKQVIEREFKVSCSTDKCIEEVERIAVYVGKDVLEVDQVFVKYGSGYYFKPSIRVIVQRMLQSGIPKLAISFCTGWSLSEIEAV